jgi:nitroreductase
MGNEKLLNDSLVKLLGKRKPVNELYHPEFFRMGKPADRTRLETLFKDNPHLDVLDELQGQLQELLKSRTPKITYTRDELSELAKAYTGETPPEEYGVWVYYPWSSMLIHLLDEDEFIEVRTNRNQYKITKAERDRLGKQKIGVVGLSVGKTISMSMAMERSFGEIRLADYDLLELTNLNRIQTGLYNLGVSKAIAVAREIAELDPWLKTVCYTDGLTSKNMDDFFLKGGKLDILVEECDGLDIKILCRQKARELKIPVVMDMNDRGTLDVERFDLEPDRPLLHGFIDHLDISRIGNLSNEEKVPYILPMLGAETISSKLKASMLEIGQTISTWPQLASSVVLGGALAADVCRRICLDQFHESGRYFVDLEELVCDQKPAPVPVPDTSPQESELTEKEMLETIRQFAFPVVDDQLELSASEITELVSAAITAPSGGNCQPWKWLYTGKTIFLFHDRIRSLSLLDYADLASYIGLGTASENLVLRAHQLGLELNVENFFPVKTKLVARFRFYKAGSVPEGIKPESHACDDLAQFITLRGTNRRIGKRQQIEETVLEEIGAAVSTIDGARLTLLLPETGMDEAGEIIASVERMRLMDKEGHRNFVNEIRWSAKEARSTRDGVDLETVDLSPTELAGFRMARHVEVIKHLNDWNGGKAFEKVARKSVAAASALGLITLPRHTAENFYTGGRALQRAWLMAGKHQISFQPLSPCTFLFARLTHGNGVGMTEKMISELQIQRAQFVRLFKLPENCGEIFLFRLCIAEQMNVKALRRPVGNVLYLK